MASGRRNTVTREKEEEEKIKIRPTGFRTVLGIRDSVYLIY